MNEKYKKFPNYIKIEKLTNDDWKLTSDQLNLLMQLSKEIYENEKYLLDILGKKEIISIFLKQILYFEQNRNSNIEGSQTQFDELFEMDRNFSDFMPWETRNLIDASLELFRDMRNDTFLLSIDSIITLHKKLYLLNKNKMLIDSKLYVKNIRPGYILSNGDPINWIGRKSSNREDDLKNANLIPIIPEDKKQELTNLINWARNKIENKTLSILDISRFHVIFEGIHPFADGNGRLGRLLILALMQIIGLTKYTILPFSEYIYKNKNEYIENLNKAQLYGDINSWNSYFIKLLINAKHIHQKIIKKAIQIIEKYLYLKSNDNKWKVFLKFFKHIKLKRDITVNKLISEGMSQATGYRLFDQISKELNCSKDGEYWVFNPMWNIYKEDFN